MITLGDTLVSLFCMGFLQRMTTQLCRSLCSISYGSSSDSCGSRQGVGTSWTHQMDFSREAKKSSQIACQWEKPLVWGSHIEAANMIHNSWRDNMGSARMQLSSLCGPHRRPRAIHRDQAHWKMESQHFSKVKNPSPEDFRKNSGGFNAHHWTSGDHGSLHPKRGWMKP